MKEDPQEQEDTRIRKAIVALLHEDSKTDASKMEIVVKHANVLLKGKADTEDEKNHASEIARLVPGVKNVENHLQVGTGIAQALSAFAAQMMSDTPGKNTTKDPE